MNMINMIVKTLENHVYHVHHGYKLLAFKEMNKIVTALSLRINAHPDGITTGR